MTPILRGGRLRTRVFRVSAPVLCAVSVACVDMTLPTPHQERTKAVMSEGTAILDTDAPPESASAMLTESAAAFVGRHVRVTRVSKPSEPGPTQFFHRFDIDEVIKGAPLLRRRAVEIEWHAGEFKTADGMIRVHIHRADDLRPGRRYLVFLSWNRFRERLYVAYPASIYDLSGAFVQPLEQNRLADRDKSPERLLEELRAEAAN